VVAFFLIFPAHLIADEPVAKSRLTGVVIGGHDTVAYHSDESVANHIATKGDKTYTVEWKGAKWRFASKEHADAFAASPENYSPAYNGHCANALSLGEGLIRTDGTHWEIFDGQLYTYFAARGRDRWMSGDWKSYKQEADRAWREILDTQ
ncbi:MAG: YHS domain-containing (seleno)protein, partial [Pseudomonadota bacterium]